jgi:hypothetical protein
MKVMILEVGKHREPTALLVQGHGHNQGKYILGWGWEHEHEQWTSERNKPKLTFLA